MALFIFPKGDITTPSSRQRAYVLGEKLSAKGYKVTISPFANSNLDESIVKIIRFVWKIKRKDVIYLQRTIYNKYFSVIILLHKLLVRSKVIFDFDDSIFLHSPFKTNLMVRSADVVTTGSHFLFKWAKKRNKNTYLIPTAIETERFEKVSHVKNEIFTIGFVGNGPVYFPALRVLAEALKGVVQKGYALKLIIIGSYQNKEIKRYFDSIAEFETDITDNIPYDRVPESVAKFDVGVMPFSEDNDWNKGKCALKALEYMACGIPTIASRVGENSYVIQDGINGLLASSQSEWEEKIILLIKNPALREKLGRAGQKTSKKYSFETIVGEFELILRDLEENPSIKLDKF